MAPLIRFLSLKITVRFGPKIDTLYVLSIKMCHLKCILNKETKNWREEEENIYSKVLLNPPTFSLEYFLQKLYVAESREARISIVSGFVPLSWSFWF